MERQNSVDNRPMKILKFILNSFLIGLVLSGILYILLFPAILIYKSFDGNFNATYVTIALALVFISGALTSLFYLHPLNFFARYFLKLLASFYSEFFKQSSAYFTRENINKPFEIVVEVRISNDIKMMGLVTDKINENLYAVFVPTSPRPSTGITIIVNKDMLNFTTIDSKEFMKYIMTSGAYRI
jgi:uncharacterized membrane protein